MPYTRTTWVDYPATTTPITAAALNNIETGILAIESGQGAITNGIFTNEAARDAAITSPVEGMRAYLTAPTVPAATGDTTALPTGITTIYNGSAWVCITPVASRTDATGSVTSTSFTATLTGSPGTNPSVTLTTGTSALITLTCDCSNNTSNSSLASVAVSGASTVASSDAVAATDFEPSFVTVSRCFVLTGLTAGVNTFTMEYRTVAGTSSLRRRSLVVQGVA
jgi:hypothetical protein